MARPSIERHQRIAIIVAVIVTIIFGIYFTLNDLTTAGEDKHGNALVYDGTAFFIFAAMVAAFGIWQYLDSD